MQNINRKIRAHASKSRVGQAELQNIIPFTQWKSFKPNFMKSAYIAAYLAPKMNQIEIDGNFKGKGIKYCWLKIKPHFFV